MILKRHRKNSKNTNHDTRTNGVVQDLMEAPISPLLADLAGPSPTTREKARNALVAMGHVAVPALIQLLADRKPHVRWEAAKALASIADPISATALAKALDDPDGDVRWVAGEGLIALGREGLQPLLAKLLEPEQPPWVSDGAPPCVPCLGEKKEIDPSPPAPPGRFRPVRAAGLRSFGRLYGALEGAGNGLTTCRLPQVPELHARRTAMIPVRNTPSEIPAPPMEAIGAPSWPIRYRFNTSAPSKQPMLPAI